MKELLIRLVTALLEAPFRMSVGMRPALIGALVRKKGPLASLRLFMKMSGGRGRALKRLGAARTNLLFAFAALLNGCHYCGYAHARAWMLHLFRERGLLFPLDEDGFLALAREDDDQVRSTLRRHLESIGAAADADMFDRVYDLKFLRARPSTEEDALYGAAIALYDEMNACALEAQLPRSDELDSIGADVALCERYARARLEVRDGGDTEISAPR